MQLKQIELLAPAKNKEIGIAAIDCGADAVYIAGPRFGAREAAGNSVEDIAELSRYAHRFGAKVFVTINTILYEEELKDAEKLIHEVYNAGADAIIAQDLSLLKMDLPPIELHASTQTVVKSVEQAQLLSSLGFTRLVLERQLSLSEIEKIKQSVPCELEAFIHGALCVCYSGQCYLSQYLAGRSANRGTCVQACRSLYDLVDEDGKVLAKNKSLLSLKDLKLDDNIEALAKAGVCSFKIEGRLKNISYVKNVVRHYRRAIDKFLVNNPDFQKSSLGNCYGGFEPNINATFNRGYTSLYLDGKKGAWNSGDAAKSMGEYIGTIASVNRDSITINSNKTLVGGDGLAFISKKGEILGCRVEKSNNNLIFLNNTEGLYKGQDIFRNLNHKFEKELKENTPERLIEASIKFSPTEITASTADGLSATFPIEEDFPLAQKPEVAIENIRRQLSKKGGDFIFNVTDISGENVGFYPTSYLNGARRSLAEALSEQIIARHEANRPHYTTQSEIHYPIATQQLNYLANCANHLSKEVYSQLGYGEIMPAYELAPVQNAELMRTRYCIKYELALCPKNPACKTGTYKKQLYLINGGRKLQLVFDCNTCEMIVK